MKLLRIVQHDPIRDHGKILGNLSTYLCASSVFLFFNSQTTVFSALLNHRGGTIGVNRMEKTMISGNIKNVLSFFLIAIILQLCGCATAHIELAPVDVDRDAKTLTPPPGKGRVYILMSEYGYKWALKAADFPIYNNQGMKTDLGSTTFIKWDLDPGAIVIYYHGSSPISPFDAFYLAEGQVLFFQWDITFDDIAGVGWIWRWLTPISNEEGRTRVLSRNMSLNKDSTKREYFDWSSATSPVQGKKLGSGFYCRGNAYFQGRKFNEAIADYSRTIELTPKLSDLARLMRSLAYKCNGQKDNAESDFQQVIKHTPEMRLMATYQMALVCDREAFVHEAIKYYQGFLEILKEREQQRVSSKIAYALGYIGSLVLSGGISVTTIVPHAHGLLGGMSVAGGNENKNILPLRCFQWNKLVY
ncbi:MAG: hypothetical protein WC378_09165 [Opitutaceae bacterium]|jgi:tetratricopeptide (TPR) repeat protein